MSSDQKRPGELPSGRDELFRETSFEEFRFDEAVARVFPDMLRRSIPGYATLLQMIGVLARSVVQPSTRAYDLGCSLGAVSLALRHGIGARDASIIAVDNSPAMVDRCREIVSAEGGLCPIDVILGDIANIQLAPCSLVVLNFTLQFVPVDERQEILRSIFGALVPGGAVVLSEKTRNSSPDVASFHADLHDAFRTENGYSKLEISRKREALERVLVPESPEDWQARLTHVGFVPYEWFRCLHFVSWVGKKQS